MRDRYTSEGFSGDHYGVFVEKEEMLPSLPERWRCFTNLTPTEFSAEMRKGVHEKAQVNIDFSSVAGQTSVVLHHRERDPCVEIQLTYSFNNTVGKQSGERSSDHISRIDAEPRDSGVGIRMLANIFRLKPIERPISLTASGTEGACFWARAGWTPIRKGKNWEVERRGGRIQGMSTKGWLDIRDTISGRLDFLESRISIPFIVSGRLRRALADDNPKSLWQVVDEKYEFEDWPLGRLLVSSNYEDIQGIAERKGWDTDDLYVDHVSYKAIFDPEDPDCVHRLQKRLGIKNVVAPQFLPENGWKMALTP